MSINAVITYRSVLKQVWKVSENEADLTASRSAEVGGLTFDSHASSAVHVYRNAYMTRIEHVFISYFRVKPVPWFPWWLNQNVWNFQFSSFFKSYILLIIFSQFTAFCQISCVMYCASWFWISELISKLLKWQLSSHQCCY